MVSTSRYLGRDWTYLLHSYTHTGQRQFLEAEITGFLVSVFCCTFYYIRNNVAHTTQQYDADKHNYSHFTGKYVVICDSNV